MVILVTGRSASGSWKIRGEQLGAAIGAHVNPKPNGMKGYDLVIVVKRPRADVVSRIHARGAPLIWDIVDAWPQPEGNDWTKEKCLEWLRKEVHALKPAALVAATEAMAADCAEFGLPVLALPHHARPGTKVTPIHDEVGVVGYEGGMNYIAQWWHAIMRECTLRNWIFMANHLSSADIVLALRDQTGYAPRHWKSNVKLANAQYSGTPVICAREQGYLETASGAERWADTPQELAEALDSLTPREARVDAQTRLIACAPTINQIAERYSSWLSALRF
jgi:hypothetical protein